MHLDSSRINNHHNAPSVSRVISASFARSVRPPILKLITPSPSITSRYKQVQSDSLPAINGVCFKRNPETVPQIASSSSFPDSIAFRPEPVVLVAPNLPYSQAFANSFVIG
ncbi:hypothetical protein PGTUg99_030310 [Puccinia graminis f. sp. tritici]|uniref:Uncharacterized protein n=1 Tax=Puccinia graminis f. sp. tritici TaxID=56615 RepID=A0A5B0S6V4_PUCGR|nr:hypothetical protein PGTUg99_030310 [Puccinia graminis f. sp. tritici]